MKRIVLLVMVVVMLTVGLFACGKKTECESCGSETTCTKVTYKGESAYLCKDCKALVDALVELEKKFS